MSPRIGKTAGLVLICLVLVGCAAQGPVHRPRGTGACESLSPAQQYAGHVLSYLMQVVLGRAGHPELKAEWSRRGLSAPLDFARISKVMLEPDRNRSQLVVFDTRILGISDVLYHYDPMLNLFKGNNSRQSLFPSVELIALRLLLLQKMHRGEKIRLKGLFDRRTLMLDPARPATSLDLSETGLTREEMRLMREAFAGDPHLFAYLFCPPLVRGLYQIGAVAADPVVSAAFNEERHAEQKCRFGGKGGPAPAVRIALLPSMVKGFVPLGSRGASGGAVFRPDETYLLLARRLKAQILKAAAERLGVNMLPAGAVVFSDPPPMPMAVYPENADAAIGRFCPEADLTIVLLGKDVIRCFDLGAQTRYPPRHDRLYIDLMDIKRSWIEAEIEVVARFIAKRLGADAGRR